MNLILIGICILVFAGQATGGMHPQASHLMLLFRWNPAGLIGHTFMHGDIFHLVFNMIFLWLFGNAVCSRVGNLAFLPIFLAAGVAGGIAHLITSRHPLVGASGAISGIIAFAMVLSPTSRVSCLFLGGLFGGIFTVNGFWLTLFWFARDVLSAFFVHGSIVAYWAHVGGFLAGGLMALGFLRLNLIGVTEDDGLTLPECLRSRRRAQEDASGIPERAPLASLDATFSSPPWLRWTVGLSLLFMYPLLNRKLNFDAPWLMLAGAVQIAPDIAGFFGDMAGGILWRHHAGKPTPIYGIAEKLTGEGRYVEAEAEYDKIMAEFPNETKPHLDLIDIAFKRLNDPRLAEQFYQRGIARLPTEEGRAWLAESYQRALQQHRSAAERSAPERRVIAFKRSEKTQRGAHDE